MSLPILYIHFHERSVLQTLRQPPLTNHFLFSDQIPQNTSEHTDHNFTSDQVHFFLNTLYIHQEELLLFSILSSFFPIRNIFRLVQVQHNKPSNILECKLLRRDHFSSITYGIQKTLKDLTISNSHLPTALQYLLHLYYGKFEGWHTIKAQIKYIKMRLFGTSLISQRLFKLPRETRLFHSVLATFLSAFFVGYKLAHSGFAVSHFTMARNAAIFKRIDASIVLSTPPHFQGGIGPIPIFLL